MLKNEKGSALIFTVLAFAVLLIFTMTFIFLGDTNVKHASKEEKKTKAYYVAKTGAESVIKHAQTSGDIIATLEDLVTQTSSGSTAKGEFDGKNFEIEVTRPDPTETRYKIKSTSKTKDSKDWTTAIVSIDEGIIFPQFDGTIFSGSRDPLDITDLSKLKGDNLKVYTPLYAESGSAVRILQPEAIRDILASPSQIKDREVKVGSDTHRLEIAEKFDNGKIKLLNIYINEQMKLSIRYGYDMKVELKEELERHDEQIKKYFGEPYKSGAFSSNNAVITENINYSTSEIRGWTIDATSEAYKEPLEIRIKSMSVLANMTIKTSKYRDVIIITDDLQMEDSKVMKVEGDGQLTILVAKNMQLDTSAKIDIAPNATVDIHLKPGVYFKLNDKSSINGGRIYGLGADVDLHGYSTFKGQIINETIGINDQANINSFSEEEINNKSKREPRVYIEWER